MKHVSTFNCNHFGLNVLWWQFKKKRREKIQQLLTVKVYKYIYIYENIFRFSKSPVQLSLLWRVCVLDPLTRREWFLSVTCSCFPCETLTGVLSSAGGRTSVVVLYGCQWLLFESMLLSGIFYVNPLFLSFPIVSGLYFVCGYRSASLLPSFLFSPCIFPLLLQYSVTQGLCVKVFKYLQKWQ